MPGVHQGVDGFFHTRTPQSGWLGSGCSILFAAVDEPTDKIIPGMSTEQRLARRKQIDKSVLFFF